MEIIVMKNKIINKTGYLIKISYTNIFKREYPGLSTLPGLLVLRSCIRCVKQGNKGIIRVKHYSAL